MTEIMKSYVGLRCMADVNYGEISELQMEEGSVTDNRVIRSL